MTEPIITGKRPRATSLAAKASLDTLLQGQTESIAAVQGWLDAQETAAGSSYAEIASLIREHLASHGALVDGAKQTQVWPTSSPSCWGPVRCSNASLGGTVLSVTGPAPEDHVKVTVSNAGEVASLEKFVGHLSKMVRPRYQTMLMVTTTPH